MSLQSLEARPHHEFEPMMEVHGQAAQIPFHMANSDLNSIKESAKNEKQSLESQDFVVKKRKYGRASAVNFAKQNFTNQVSAAAHHHHSSSMGQVKW